MFASLHKVGRNGCLSESLARLKPMQALHQDKPLTVRRHKNRGFLPLFHHALGQSLDLLPIQGLPPLHRHTDILDRKGLLSTPSRLLLRRVMPDGSLCPAAWFA
jgi:hypothetical protein